MGSEGFYSKSLHHYEEARKECPDWLDYDGALQETMRGIVLGIRTVGIGTNNPSFVSFDSLSRAVMCLLRNNHQAAKVMLACKKEIRSKGQLLLVVTAYFKLSKKTEDSLLKLQLGLRVSKDKLTKLCCDPINAKAETAVRYAATFAGDFIRLLPDLIGEHIQLLKTLQESRKEQIGGKLSKENGGTRRRVTRTLLLAVFVAGLICTVLVAALHAPPTLAALPAAAISLTSWEPFVNWLNGLWKENEQALREGMAEKIAVWNQGSVMIQDLEDMVNYELKAGGASGQSPSQNRGKRISDLTKSMAELAKHVERCSDDICKTRRQFLNKIT